MSEKSLSVAHIHWAFPPTIGGVETHLSILLPELVRRGHRQAVLTANVAGLSDRDTFGGADVFRSPLMDLNRLLASQTAITEEQVRKEFTSFLDAVRPDIIHAHNMHYFTRIHAGVLREEARKRKTKLILTAHNVWDEEIFLDLTVHFPWDHIIAVSHFIKRETAGCGFDDSRITVVHHGIDTGMFKRRTDLEPLYEKYPGVKGKRVIFHPARISLGKGAMTSIKAAGIVKKNIHNLLLVLAGSGNIIDWDAHMEGDMKFISALVRALGLEDNIYIDSFSIEQMAELYNLSEVCVYPSSAQEPFGLTMLEAQASEKAIVVTRAGGMAEIIHDGINGYVVPVRHHEDLAHRVLTLMNDADLRRRLGTVGRTNVLTHFTKEMMAAATLDVYRAVLNTTK